MSGFKIWIIFILPNLLIFDVVDFYLSTSEKRLVNIISFDNKFTATTFHESIVVGIRQRADKKDDLNFYVVMGSFDGGDKIECLALL